MGHGVQRRLDSKDEALEKQLSAIAVEIIVAGQLPYCESMRWLSNDAIRCQSGLPKELLKKKLAAEQAEWDRLAKLKADLSRD